MFLLPVNQIVTMYTVEHFNCLAVTLGLYYVDGGAWELGFFYSGQAYNQRWAMNIKYWQDAQRSFDLGQLYLAMVIN